MLAELRQGWSQEPNWRAVRKAGDVRVHASWAHGACEGTPRQAQPAQTALIDGTLGLRQRAYPREPLHRCMSGAAEMVDGRLIVMITDTQPNYKTAKLASTGTEPAAMTSDTFFVRQKLMSD